MFRAFVAGLFTYSNRLASLKPLPSALAPPTLAPRYFLILFFFAFQFRVFVCLASHQTVGDAHPQLRGSEGMSPRSLMDILSIQQESNSSSTTLPSDNSKNPSSENAMRKVTLPSISDAHGPPRACSGLF